MRYCAGKEGSFIPQLLKKRPLSRLGRGGAGLAVGLLLLLGMGLVFPRAAAFFPLVSLWCSCALFLAALWVLRCSDTELHEFHWIVLAAVWAAAVVYFYWALGRRRFIYVWDYANYLTKQYEAEAAFADGPAAGFAFLFGSFADDYTNFITLFTEFPFCLTARTGDSYAFAQAFCILPTLLVLLAGLVVKVGRLMQVRHTFYYFLIGLSWTVTYPWLRMSAVLAQPDWFGLIFAFAILLLTLDFRFDRLEPARFGAIFLATAAIILTRRWYLYFVVGYCFAYAVCLLAGDCRLARTDKPAALRRVRNLLLFGLMALAAMVVLLWPMVRHILTYDYADRYAYYDAGGMLTEVYLQTLRLGLFNLILIGAGLWFAFRRRQGWLAGLAGLEILVGMVLFTRVQNTGSHQMLLFLPGWFLLFLLGAAALAEGIDRARPLKLGFWAVTLCFAVAARCGPQTELALPDFLIKHYPIPKDRAYMEQSTRLYDRTDYDQIVTIAQWIDAHCAEGEISYMIPHDMLYCPDHFKNCQLPATPIHNKLAYGFSVPGTHSFPMEFFEAKYVLTADPFPQTNVGPGEMSIRLNQKFLALRDTTHQKVATFDMGNGTVFTIWERTVAPTRAEVEEYLHVFDAENAQYPEMFSQVAEGWLAAHGL